MTDLDTERLFSIVMATYNRVRILPRSIDSVLHQTYQNFELIIVDDGSSDNTEDVCRSYTDRRIIYHRLSQNEGALAARNRGIDLAKGHYLTFLDDDDELSPEALDTAAQTLREVSGEGIRWVWFDGIYVASNLRSGFGMDKRGLVRYEDALCEKVGGNFWGVMERSLLGQDDRFDERLWGEEGILWLKLLRNWKALYVPKVLYKYHREPGVRLFSSKSRMKNLARTTLTHKVFLEKYGAEIKLICPKIYGRKLGVYGASEILVGNKPGGRKACLEAFKYYKSFDTLVVFLCSFFIPSNWMRSLAYYFMSVISR